MTRWLCDGCNRKPEIGDAYCPYCCGFIPFDKAAGSDVPRYTGTQDTWIKADKSEQVSR